MHDTPDPNVKLDPVTGHFHRVSDGKRTGPALRPNRPVETVTVTTTIREAGGEIAEIAIRVNDGATHWFDTSNPITDNDVRAYELARDWFKESRANG